MPNKDTNSRLIYHHLSEIDRLADERERLGAQIREANVAWNHHVAAVEPYFAKLGGAAINVYNRVMWLDPVHGIRVKKLRPWIALVPDVEPVILTDAQIDEGALHAARRDETGMPDAVLEAMAEAWDTNEDSELHTITTLWGHVQSNGRVS